MVHQLHTFHPRKFASNRFVYPVLSRRSGGISIGVNLNPDKICNFDCIYCQVDRTSPSETRFVELEQLCRELESTLLMVASGEIYLDHALRNTPPAERRLRDIAFSGDGEPTTYKNFDEVMDVCAALKRRHGLDEVKMVLITNASMLHRPHVQRGLTILDENEGEIWAKLEAGTEQYYKQIERTSIPLSQIVENITSAARVRPLVIQALFMRVDGVPVPLEEQEAFCERLQQITDHGGQIRLVQVYTVARRPAESYVTPLRNDEVDAITQLVRRKTQLHAVSFYGATGSDDEEG